MRLTSEITSHLSAIPDGKTGTLATLQLMARVTALAKRSPELRLLAAQLVYPINSGNSKHTDDEIKIIHQFVRDKIRYLRDIRGIETIQTPQKTMELGYGDCDDKSTLAATLLELIGYKTRFVAVGFDGRNFCHVYPEVFNKKQWVPVETTENVPCGWCPPNIKNRLIVDVQ